MEQDVPRRFDNLNIHIAQAENINVENGLSEKELKGVQEFNIIRK